jgi:diguanylate cyclase (GGDEF)-like protein
MYTFDYEFTNSGIYYSNDTSTLSNPDKEFMEKNGIKAVMYIPLFNGSKVVGFIGFDLLDSVRKWDDLHISAFQNIANVIATIIYRKNAEQKLNFYAKYDILTGIYNRRWGEKLLTEVMNSETRLSFVLCFIDMDGLKYINDTFTHDAGDYAIKKIVGTIDKYLFAEDVFSRYGGDEFLLMLPRRSLEYVGYLFENVETELEILSKDLEYKLSISYGYIETNNYTNLSISELIYVVDEKMYEQKLAKKAARK